TRFSRDWSSDVCSSDLAGVPLVVFGIPDMAQETTRYAIEIPRLGGLILAHEWDASFPGLKDFPPEDRPNSTIVFWTFRVMAGLSTEDRSVGTEFRHRML